MIEGRLERLRSMMAENEVDAFVSLKLVNTFYLSGFTSLDTARPTSYVRPVCVVVDHTSACLIVPLLDEEAAGQSSAVRDIRCYSASPAPAAARALVAERLREIGAARIAVEEDAISAEWLDFFNRELPGTEVRYGRRWIEALRMVKDESEIEVLRHAARLSDIAIAGSLAACAPGLPEIAAETQGVLALRDAAAASGDVDSIVDAIPMVLCGPRSSMPHEFTTSRPMQVGEVMWHCWLVSYRGYWVENIRTAVVGGDVSRFAGPFAALKESVLAGQEAARPGATAADVHKAIMGVLEKRPEDGGFLLNRAGHGMGLEYHEPPFNEEGDVTALQPGTVLTIEPGIWFPGTGGMSVSNTIVVREDGAEVLTVSPVDLEETSATAGAPVPAEA